MRVPIASLPVELFNMICEHLTYSDTKRFGLTNRHIHAVVRDQLRLWTKNLRPAFLNMMYADATDGGNDLFVGSIESDLRRSRYLASLSD
jgi:hypothetical protein